MTRQQTSEPDETNAATQVRGVNFADVERDWVAGRIYPGFQWRAYDDFSSYQPLRVPLSSARVAFVTTAGAHLVSQEPFNTGAKAGDPSWRAIPGSTALDDLLLTHVGYDTRRAAQDKNVVLPVDHLREAVRAGRIGELAPTIYSCMGYVADTDPLVDESAPAIAARLREEQVDLVLLAPT